MVRKGREMTVLKPERMMVVEDMGGGEVVVLLKFLIIN